MTKEIILCDTCKYGNDTNVKADWIAPFKHGEALCNKCYKEILEGYKKYKRIK